MRWTSATPRQERSSLVASVVEILRGIFAPSTRRVSPFSHPHRGVCLQFHSRFFNLSSSRSLSISDFLRLSCYVKISTLSAFIDAAEQDNTLFLLCVIIFFPDIFSLLKHPSSPLPSSSFLLLSLSSSPLLSCPLSVSDECEREWWWRGV